MIVRSNRHRDSKQATKVSSKKIFAVQKLTSFNRPKKL